MIFVGHKLSLGSDYSVLVTVALVPSLLNQLNRESTFTSFKVGFDIFLSTEVRIKTRRSTRDSLEALDSTAAVSKLSSSIFTCYYPKLYQLFNFLSGGQLVQSSNRMV